MKRSELKEKTKRSVCLFFAATLILCITLTTGNAFAGKYSDAAKSAKQKEYYYALNYCVDGHIYNNTNTQIKNGKLFFTKGFGVSPFVEVQLEKKYDDGAISCSSDGFVKTAAETLGITLEELACALYDSSGGDCHDDFNAGTSSTFIPKSRSDRQQNLESLVKQKTGLTNLTNLTIEEQYYLYSDAFMSVCATDRSTAHLDNPENYTFQIMIYNTETKEFQRAGYSGQDKDLWLFRDQRLKCSQIASALDENGSLYSQTKDAIINEINSGESPESMGVVTQKTAASITESGDKCYDGAGAIGWVLCPIVSTASSLLESTYSTIEKEYLQIDSISLFNRRPDGGIVGVDPVPDSNTPDESTLHIIWATFRDIANIAFIIFILIVILSQVTGIGIDNYGIKKMLPRLIIAAIIVNLSYFVCMAVVDLSNIVGIGIKDIFSDFTAQITTNSAAATSAGAGQNIVVMGGLMAIGIGVLLISPGLILTLACFLIGMVISVLFLWLILICRQAGLILAIGLSPLAFVCYLFPNTEKLFKRWVNLMKGLLLLYPICTFVISGGMLAGNVFASMNNAGQGTSTGLTLAAMIVPVIPYLFIPSILRNSINVMGKLGATIGRLGRTVNQGTVGRFQKSDAAKRMRTSMNSWDAGGLRSRVSATKFGKYTGLQQSTARKIAAREKMRSDDRSAQALLQREKFARMEQRNPNNVSLTAFEAQLDAATNSANGGERYDAILTEIERRYGSSKAADLAMKTIDKNQNSALLTGKNREEFMRKLAQNHQSTFAKTPDFGKYLQYGGVHRNSITGATTHTSFAGTNADASRNFLTQDVNIGDFKDNQITASNSNSVYRMIAAGKITQADAQRIMSNDDIRGSMDSVQQAILAASYDRGGVIGGAMQLPKGEVEAAFAGQTTWNDGGTTRPVRITQAQANALVA